MPKRIVSPGQLSLFEPQSTTVQVLPPPRLEGAAAVVASIGVFSFPCRFQELNPWRSGLGPLLSCLIWQPLNEKPPPLNLVGNEGMRVKGVCQLTGLVQFQANGLNCLGLNLA
jgi:hypothetical protein